MNLRHSSSFCRLECVLQPSAATLTALSLRVPKEGPYATSIPVGQRLSILSSIRRAPAGFEGEGGLEEVNARAMLIARCH